MKLLLPVALLACFLPLASFGAGLAMQRSGPVSWVCGGVGSDERRDIEALRPQARLEVLFVTKERGGYLSDAELAVYDGHGEPLLQVSADGPICLLDAPAGSYVLSASYGGVTRKARAIVAKDGAARKVVFAFPEEPWDGIRASPEERAQAARP